MKIDPVAGMQDRNILCVLSPVWLAGDCDVGDAAGDYCSGVDAGDCCVDPVFRLVWSKCLCTIAADGGGYLHTSFDVISGSEVRKHPSITSHRVESTGKPKAIWRKVIH